MGDLGYKLRNYHPDIELNERGDSDYGHFLADAIIKSRKTLKDKHKIERESKIIQILGETHPKYITNAPRKNTKLKGILGKLNRLGFEVGDYSKMSEVEKWNLYISIMKNFNLI